VSKFPDSDSAGDFEEDEGTEQASASSMATFAAPAGGKAGAKTVIEAGAGAERKPPYNWSLLTVAELVRFRDEINRTLPPTELSRLNLEEETLLQYHTLRELQSAVMDEKEVPVNQRAQVANSVGAVLKNLGDQQITLYSSERFKAVENLLIRTLTKLPEDVARDFINDYEKILLNHGKK
jgi:hypothetical protein